MGMLDHRRTWEYDVAATPDACIEAFGRAFSGGGGLIRASWAVNRTGKGAVATYKGRKGIGALGGVLSKTAAQEQDTAIGSTVTFQINGSTGGRTVCSMWLSGSGRSGIGGLMGATSDARFIRPYMQAVRSQLLALDASAHVTSH
ncbi:hypothetical protein OM076_42835 [Solirubrobacter ginsenosidimutans]|uniref:Uncharacterized protein n=1 Tax=Solirubrobacter ginsenosidimutans TaxID=490573 RepID=A0A9X3N227_9ACTN|nr:hypothetical protein [Solirubrobacter ginsenosidimutans]MDA0167074.1 hypothetical protein [Solirubrobacter ginsenosidimutans]